MTNRIYSAVANRPEKKRKEKKSGGGGEAKGKQAWNGIMAFEDVVDASPQKRERSA